MLPEFHGSEPKTERSDVKLEQRHEIGKMKSKKMDRIRNIGLRNGAILLFQEECEMLKFRGKKKKGVISRHK